ncbi:hypothetical protein [Glaciihabitans sp. INWT7]|nr:hypothetical protein [Glaciihabitans sp. INWT7]
MDKRRKAVGKAVREGVVGALIEEPVGDLRLLVSAHETIFSRNDRYVYR